MKLRTASILGCGWLGFSLAEHLVQCGLTVRGSTTSPDKLDRLAEAGIEPHQIAVSDTMEGDDLDAFFASDVILVTIPPSKSSAAYPSMAHAIRDAAEQAGAGWVVMTSSTSVYPNLDGIATESDAGAHEGLPLRRHGADLLAAERVFYGSERFDTTVLRLAGLYGYGRHPARSLAGREGLSGGEAPVNLVHRDDVIGAVELVLDREARGQTFNVCADSHPTRQRLYVATAQALDLTPPTFDDGPAAGYKLVSNERLRTLGYTFQHPDPMASAP